MSETLCPLKFAGPVVEIASPSGMKRETPVCVKNCAWYIDNGCAVALIAKSSAK